MKHSIRLIAVVLSIVVAAVGRGAENDAGALRVEFQETAIEISDVTRSSSVVVFGVAREARNKVPSTVRVVRHDTILWDDDGDGVVRYELDRPVPAVAMWAFVDLANGASAVLPSPGYEPVRLDLTGGAVKHDNAGQLRKLEMAIAELDLLLVRPGSGVWRLSTSRRAGLDENRESHGPLRIDVAAMTPLGGSPAAPHSFKPGDVVVVMNPRWMKFGAEVVGK